MITQDRLKQILKYDPETGEFFHLKVMRGRTVGARAGSLIKGYIWIRADGLRFSAARLAWFYMTGFWAPWPQYEVDHIDRNPTNNRFSNLRLATSSQNKANSVARRTNKTGVKGVERRKNGWSARIVANRKNIFLGVYPTIEEASAAYHQAAVKHFGQFARVK